MKRKIVYLIFILAFALSLSLSSSALVAKTKQFYVADYADVLSSSTEQMIISTNAKLEKLTGGQIVIVTVEYLDGLKSSEYAVRLMNDWGVGDKLKNNGMLLLLATQENKAWLTQGAGISASFTSNKINDLLNKYFWKDFDNEKYDAAVNSVFKQMVGWYESYYKVSLSSVSSGSTSGNASVGGVTSGSTSGSTGAAGGVTSNSMAPKNTQNGSPFGVIAFFVLLIIIIAAISVSSKKRRKNNYSTRMDSEQDSSPQPNGNNYPGNQNQGWSSGFSSGFIIGSMDSERHERHHHTDGHAEDSYSGSSYGGGLGGHSGGGGGGRSDDYSSGGSSFDSGSSSYDSSSSFDSGGSSFDGGGGVSDGGGGGRD